MERMEGVAREEGRGGISPQLGSLDPPVEEGGNSGKGRRLRMGGWVGRPLQALLYFHFKHWIRFSS